MATAFSIVALVLLVYYLLVLARVLVDVTRSFARSWRPVGATAVGLEVVYASTDPPVRALRRLIPPLRLGPVSIDLSVWLLLIAILILRTVFLSLAR